MTDREVAAEIKRLIELEEHTEDWNIKIGSQEDIEILKNEVFNDVMDYIDYTNISNNDLMDGIVSDELWDAAGYGDIFNYINNVDTIPTYQHLLANIIDNLIDGWDAVASYGVSNTQGVLIYKVEDVVYDVVIAGDGVDRPQGYRLYYKTDGSPYFNYNGYNIYLDDCMKIWRQLT